MYQGDPRAQRSGEGLKSGRRPLTVPVRHLPAGKTLFHEGDRGRDVFVIQDGKLSVTHGKGVDVIELTRLGKGAIVGEMALIDNLPRSATVKAAEDSTVTVISHLTFQAILKMLPLWFRAVLKVVSSRIRDTNQRIGRHTIPDTEVSLAHYLSRLFYEERILKKKTSVSFEYFELLDTWCFLTRASRETFKNELEKLEKREFVTFTRDSQSNRLVQIPDGEILDIFCELRRNEREGKEDPVLHLDSSSIRVLDFLQDLLDKQSKIKAGELTLPRRNFLDLLAKFGNNLKELHLMKLQQLRVILTSTSGEGSFTVHVPTFQRIRKTRRFAGQLVEEL